MTVFHSVLTDGIYITCTNDKTQLWWNPNSY